MNNGKRPRGSAHYASRLTEDDVREIVRLYRTGDHTTTEIARRFEVSNGHVSEILNGHAWRHLTGIAPRSRRSWSPTPSDGAAPSDSAAPPPASPLATVTITVSVPERLMVLLERLLGSDAEGVS